MKHLPKRTREKIAKEIRGNSSVSEFSEADVRRIELKEPDYYTPSHPITGRCEALILRARKKAGITT